MVNNLQKKILRQSIRYILAIEIIDAKNNEENDTYINAILLKKVGTQISILNEIKEQTFGELEKWIKKITEKYICIVNINSDKIVHKILNGEDSNDSIEKIFPSIDVTSFYLQNFFINKYTIISVCRKPIVDSLLERISFIKQPIIHISLGPFTSLMLENYLSTTGVIQFENYIVRINDDEIIDFNCSPYVKGIREKYFEIGGEKVSSKVLVAYSYAIYWILNIFCDTPIQPTIINSRKNEFAFKKLKDAYILVVGFAIFLVLITSSAIFTSYHQKYIDVSSNYNLQIANSRKLSEQRKLVQEMQEKRFQNGMISDSRLSYYADEITSIIPVSIQLKRLGINPISNVNATDNPEFTNKIIVEGTCNEGRDLEEWVRNIKQKTWVDNVIVKKYTEESDDDGIFILEISNK